MWQERAARRDFKPDYVGFGSFSTEVSKACLSTGVCFTPDTVAKRFLASDRRTFFHFRARTYKVSFVNSAVHVRFARVVSTGRRNTLS